MAFGLLTPSIPVKAALSKKEIKKCTYLKGNQVVYATPHFTLYGLKKENTFEFVIGSYPQKVKITNLKTSNPSVVYLKFIDAKKRKPKDSYDSYYTFSPRVRLIVKKDGKATISYKVNGVPMTYKIDVDNYKCPVESFSFGGKSYLKSLKKYYVIENVKVKPNKKYKKAKVPRITEFHFK